MKDYEISNKLGEGAYGKVYKVKSKLDSEVYVMKKIDLSKRKEEEKKKAIKEVEIM